MEMEEGEISHKKLDGIVDGMEDLEEIGNTPIAYVKCFYKKEFLDFVGNDDNTTRTFIITVVSTMGSVIGFIVCVCIFLKRRKQKKNPK
ncbi:hypothetical protein RHSIM_Rhsim07G0196000 [Rhododendron simsii]|uniref:Uncharacterized protein n=1 Tax=Rhododendron simsii TaxID=118357 RepID=A0A834GQB1_RHOSS|nr:hypothetical protein RHSIM_Rhsim07G0196000 [Rhododendron simsii]